LARARPEFNQNLVSLARHRGSTSVIGGAPPAAPGSHAGATNTAPGTGIQDCDLLPGAAGGGLNSPPPREDDRYFCCRRLGRQGPAGGAEHRLPRP
jgi:hypothetical protein